MADQGEKKDYRWNPGGEIDRIRDEAAHPQPAKYFINEGPGLVSLFDKNNNRLGLHEKSKVDTSKLIEREG